MGRGSGWLGVDRHFRVGFMKEGDSKAASLETLGFGEESHQEAALLVAGGCRHMLVLKAAHGSCIAVVSLHVWTDGHTRSRYLFFIDCTRAYCAVIKKKPAEANRPHDSRPEAAWLVKGWCMT